MSNEDPDSIPQQIRSNRPFVVALLLGVVIAIGAFLWVLATPKPDQLERSVIQDPNSPTGEATPNTGFLGTEAPPEGETTTPAEPATPAPAATQ